MLWITLLMLAMTLAVNVLVWVVKAVDLGLNLYDINSILVGVYWVVVYITACIAGSQVKGSKWYKFMWGPFYLMSLLNPAILITLIYFFIAFILYGVSLAFLDQKSAFRYPLSLSSIFLIMGFNSFIQHIKYNEITVHSNNTFWGHMFIYGRGYIDKLTRFRLYMNAINQSLVLQPNENTHLM